jgi:RNA polymerase sigma factor (sigma-70 family)
MTSSPSIKQIVVRWQAGEQAAATELFQRYSRRLWELATAQIDRQLERRVDADDILQSVFRTFFRRSAEGEYTFDHSGALWQLLVTITLNKIRKQATRHRTKKRDFRREISLDGDDLSPEAVAHDPSVEEAEALLDEMRFAVAELEPPEPEILHLCMEGHTPLEIANRLGWTRWRVRRVLDRIGARLRKRLQENRGE